MASTPAATAAEGDCRFPEAASRAVIGHGYQDRLRVIRSVTS
jgi:hypothetical protein